MPTFVGYVRDPQGNGVGSATVEVFAITDLPSNAKSDMPVASTTPDPNNGRYSISVNESSSPTGFFARKISQGGVVRWIEGDALPETVHKALPESSITDSLIGSRTVTQGTEPSGNTGNLTNLLSGLANRIRAITGESNWWSSPVVTLRQLNDRFLGNSNGHSHSGTTGQGPRLNPETALTWTPATENHNHDDRYRTQSWISANIYTKSQSDNRYELKGASSGGGSVSHADTADYAYTAGSTDSADSATNAQNLRGLDGRHFVYMWDNMIPNLLSNTGPHRMMIGTAVVTTNNFGSAWINYPRSFPNATRWIMVSNGGSGGYRGGVACVATSRSNFEVRLQTDESRQVRINWWAIGN